MEKFELIQIIREALPNKRHRKFLIKIMSEMSESSYRRGVQQALHLEKEERLLKKFNDPSKVAEWRYSNKDKSPGLDGYNTSSKERFLIENLEWEGFDA